MFSSNTQQTKETPICLTVHWNDDLMLLIFYFHNAKLLRFSDGQAGFWAKMIPRKLTLVPPTILIQSFVSQEGTCRCHQPPNRNALTIDL